MREWSLRSCVAIHPIRRPARPYALDITPSETLAGFVSHAAGSRSVGRYSSPRYTSS